MNDRHSGIGRRLKVEIVRRGLTQRQVAVGAELTFTVLSDIVCGWRRPTPEQLARICRVIGIDPADLEHAA